MIASAPAKIILVGEHAVVYGYPAIAAPVSSLRATATITTQDHRSGLLIEASDINKVLPIVRANASVNDALTQTVQLVLSHFGLPAPNATIQLASGIPMASGLGSGAAVTAALGRAVAQAMHQTLHDDDLNRIVYEVEKLHHGTPSGIDNTVIVYEKPVYFIRDEPLRLLDIGSSLHLVIGDTGQPSLTKKAVGDVRRLHDAEPATIQPILAQIGSVVENARETLAQGDISALGALMNANHRLLQKLTVSSDALERLVAAALDGGAYGAKLSGGGRGGNMIALVAPDSVDHVRKALLEAGASNTYVTEVR